MKKTQGFVAVTKSGRFYCVGERSTHTGHHIDIGIVDDMDNATVFLSPRAMTHTYKKVDLPADTTFVPVEVRREVILLGFGVKKLNKSVDSV